jgi:hypothetical protein
MKYHERGKKTKISTPNMISREKAARISKPKIPN